MYSPRKVLSDSGLVTSERPQLPLADLQDLAAAFRKWTIPTRIEAEESKPRNSEHTWKKIKTSSDMVQQTETERNGRGVGERVVRTGNCSLDITTGCETHHTHTRPHVSFCRDHKHKRVLPFSYSSNRLFDMMFCFHWLFAILLALTCPAYHHVEAMTNDLTTQAETSGDTAAGESSGEPTPSAEGGGGGGDLSDKPLGMLDMTKTYLKLPGYPYTDEFVFNLYGNHFTQPEYVDGVLL
eukprot:GHVS01034414.1.p1 GENE.GHVS01034414.1~~GHVS01034414.1.p1  ORF type:complete len:239 (-),score=19.69 GHVS01034414.1:98-814(-)